MQVLTWHNLVDSLRSLLLALDNEYKKPHSSFRHLTPVQEGQLAARLQDCRADLRSVKAILHDFRSLDTGDARYRDKLAFTSGKQAAIRDKIGAHSARLQQLLSGLNVATFSRIERNTEAHYLSLLEIHGKLDKIRMDISSGRRNAVAVDDTNEAVALEDEILDDNMTDPDVDVSLEIFEWINQVNRYSWPLISEGYSSAPTHYLDDNLSLFSVGSRSLGEGVNATANNFTFASITYNGRQLKIASNAVSLEARAHRSFGEEHHFHEKEKRWVKGKPWPNLLHFGKRNATNTFHILEFSLEEIYSGASRHLDVVRRISPMKGYDTSSFEELSLSVQIGKGFRKNDTMRYCEAGNRCVWYTESLVFVVQCVSMCIFEFQHNILKITQKKQAVFGGRDANLTHTIQISTIEAIEGWEREIRHPSGKTIEIYAGGSTNVGRFLEMENYGLPYRDKPGTYGRLLIWIQVTDIGEISAKQSAFLKLHEGPYFARVKGRRGRTYESTGKHPYGVFTFGLSAMRHSQAWSAGAR